MGVQRRGDLQNIGGRGTGEGGARRGRFLSTCDVWVAHSSGGNGRGMEGGAALCCRSLP